MVTVYFETPATAIEIGQFNEALYNDLTPALEAIAQRHGYTVTEAITE